MGDQRNKNQEKVIIDHFVNTINSFVRGGLFSVSLLDKPEARKELGGALPDYELFYDNRLIGAVEVNPKLVFVDKMVRAFRRIVPQAYRFVIVTDGNQAIIFDFTLESNWDRSVYRDRLSRSIVELLVSEKEFVNDDGVAIEVQRIIYAAIVNLVSIVKENDINTGSELPKKSEIDESYFIDIYKKEITSVSKGTDFRKKFEYILFDILVDAIESGSLIYRYTTLDAVFNTVNRATYRINGIQGMNDQSEGFHILKSIFGDGIEFERSQDLADRFNQIFVSSCSTSNDSLTMWRLYGDNSRGVCLEIEVVDNLKVPFFIKKVAYVKKNNQLVLRVLFNLIKELEGLGYRVSPELFCLILFFMKNNKYSIEREVRILYDRELQNEQDESNMNSDWGIAEPFKIMRPFVELSLLDDDLFSSGALPFKIKRIILGPNCPKEVRNELQFNTLLKEKGLDYIRVEQSKIDRDLYIG